MKTRADYARYETAALGMAAAADDAGERDYFLARAELHRTQARHCEQAQAGYFYCEATEGDPCGPGRHPHDGHNGSCATR